jgi:hypothetical protein
MFHWRFLLRVSDLRLYPTHFGKDDPDLADAAKRMRDLLPVVLLDAETSQLYSRLEATLVKFTLFTTALDDWKGVGEEKRESRAEYTRQVSEIGGELQGLLQQIPVEARDALAKTEAALVLVLLPEPTARSRGAPSTRPVVHRPCNAARLSSQWRARNPPNPSA